MDSPGGFAGITTGGKSGEKEKESSGGGTVWGAGENGFFSAIAGTENPMEE